MEDSAHKTYLRLFIIPKYSWNCGLHAYTTWPCKAFVLLSIFFLNLHILHAISQKKKIPKTFAKAKACL